MTTNNESSDKNEPVTLADVQTCARSLKMQGTPWSMGCAFMLEKLWAQYNVAIGGSIRSAVGMGKPVAWRYRYHHATLWKYADTEEECNHGLQYEREPLYTAPVFPELRNTELGARKGSDPSEIRDTAGSVTAQADPLPSRSGAFRVVQLRELHEEVVTDEIVLNPYVQALEHEIVGHSYPAPSPVAPPIADMDVVVEVIGLLRDIEGNAAVGEPGWDGIGSRIKATLSTLLRIRNSSAAPSNEGAKEEEFGPCSCQDSGKCRYVNGGPACMNEASPSNERRGIVEGEPFTMPDGTRVEMNECGVFRSSEGTGTPMSLRAFGSPDALGTYCIKKAQREGCNEWKIAYDLLYAERSATLPTELKDDRFTGAFIERFVEEWKDPGEVVSFTEGDRLCFLDFAVALVQDLTGEPFEEFVKSVLPNAVDSRSESK